MDLANQSACAGPYIPEQNNLAPQPQLTAAETLNIASGDALFKGNCAQCHAINEVVVGPALAGVRKRRPEKWLHAWVKNSSKLIASGDEYALKIYEQYDKQQMPSYNLSNEEISQILDYVESEERRYVVSAVN
ncbi:cytochrome c [Hymenobacter sp. ISL-91]|nr:cytochrome c [Hymenobacter sp. ISL-91]